jgi:hypothetical protein
MKARPEPREEKRAEFRKFLALRENRPSRQVQICP